MGSEFCEACRLASGFIIASAPAAAQEAWAAVVKQMLGIERAPEIYLERVHAVAVDESELVLTARSSVRHHLEQRYGRTLASFAGEREIRFVPLDEAAEIIKEMKP